MMLFGELGINTDPISLFKGKAQRNATMKLFQTYGFTEPFDMVYCIPMTSLDEYSPQIINPGDLLYKYQRYLKYVNRRKAGEILM